MKTPIFTFFACLLALGSAAAQADVTSSINPHSVVYLGCEDVAV